MSELRETATTVNDPLGPDGRWGNLTPMIGYLIVTGVILTVGVYAASTWVYALGLVLAAGWVTGFVAAPPAKRWFRW